MDGNTDAARASWNYNTCYLAPQWEYVSLSTAAETCYTKFSAIDPGGGRGGSKGGDPTTMVKNPDPSSENWDLREKWVTQHYD